MRLKISLLLLLLPSLANAHPMDFGSMEVEVVWNQLRVNLKLHALAVEKFAKLSHSPTSEKELKSITQTLFQNTLGQATPLLKGESCVWKNSTLVFSQDKDFLELLVLADCKEAPKETPFTFELPLPFLKDAPPAFELVAQVKGYGAPITLLANHTKTSLEISTNQSQSFGGFLRLGTSHIGALPDEWNTKGKIHLPEGIDHILFVAALVLGGGALWGLFKCVSGFTLGHTLTLGLTAFKIIHIHSRWVEAFIALSIAYVAASTLLRPKSPHRWMVATIFGTIHGLGFASALQELELHREQLLPAVLGFNLGVELGQCMIICITLLFLWLVKKMAGEMVYLWIHRSMAMGLFLIGTYWFILRAVN